MCNPLVNLFGRDSMRCTLRQLEVETCFVNNQYTKAERPAVISVKYLPHSIQNVIVKDLITNQNIDFISPNQEIIINKYQ